jgi:hypothetical protein
MEFCSAVGDSLGEQVGGLMAIYYLLNRNYPAAYGQMLGLIQEKILLVPFAHKNKKLSKFIQTIT